MLRRIVVSSSVRAVAASPLARLATSASDAHQAQAQGKHNRAMRGVDLNKLTFADVAERVPSTWSNPHDHSVWSKEDCEAIQVNHRPTNGMIDTAAYALVKLCRFMFDTFSLYRFQRINERAVLRRCLFLESVAGVPGMVGGMLRHMSSLRNMRRDAGWIASLLEEATNERMHLLTFMEMYKPGFIFRMSILISQGVFFNLLFVLYILCPRFVHRFVGYLEEEACRTYTHILKSIDNGDLPEFAAAQAPAIAKAYWCLDDKSKVRDMFAQVLADEAAHRVVNHTFADLHEAGKSHATNPFVFLGHAHGQNQ